MTDWQGALPADSTGYWNCKCDTGVHKTCGLAVNVGLVQCGSKGGPPVAAGVHSLLALGRAGSAIMVHFSAHFCVRIV